VLAAIHSARPDRIPVNCPPAKNVLAMCETARESGMCRD